MVEYQIDLQKHTEIREQKEECLDTLFSIFIVSKTLPINP